MLGAAFAHGDTMSVRRIQRPFQQTMVVRSESGRIVANGSFSQTVDGDLVTMHLIYCFVDGSIDEETTVFRQRSTFELVKDRHVQQGPYFTRPFDFEVDADAKATTSWSVNREGVVHIDTRNMNLPHDLANGFIGTLMLNAPDRTRPFKVEMVVPFNGGRLVRLRVSKDGERQFVADGREVKAAVYRVHPDLGGFTGILAGLLGLKPKDVMVWVLPGDEPVVVRTVGQLGGYGPVVSVDVQTTTFSK
jgi:hypothetical protein